MYGKEKLSGWRLRLHVIIFEADTPAGKFFDLALLIVILLSVVAIMLESVEEIRAEYGTTLRVIEYCVTGLFTIEYILRIVSTGKPWRYIFSFFGIVDMISFLPTYLSFFLVGSQFMLVIRAIRLLRVFRVLKLTRYLGEAAVLRRALSNSFEKIIVFLGTVLVLTVIIGAAMYLIEGPENGFTSIPKSIYWSIVTLTTVGYGDISPQTVPGQMLASIVMLMGYGIIAVPTGLVSVEYSRAFQSSISAETSCQNCGTAELPADSNFCKSCGHPINH
ncbi:MAG: ion transporter [Bacteroidia bacterium]